MTTETSSPAETVAAQIEALHAQGTRRRAHLSGGWLLIGYTVLSVVVWGLGLGLAASGYGRTVAQGEAQTAGLASLARGQIKAVLDSVDLGLKLLAYRMTVSDWQVLRSPSAVAAEQRAAITGLIADVERAVPVPARLFVLGPDGTILAWSSHRPLPETDFADRPYFQAHRRGATAGVHVGGLIGPRLLDAPAFTLSRRLNGTGSGFAGVAGAAISPRVFDTAFAEVATAATTLSVVNAQGEELIRYPADSPAAPPAGSQSTHRAVGKVLRQADAEGNDSFIAMDGLPLYGLTIVARQPVAAATEEWRTEALSLLAAGATIYLLLTMAVVKNVRQMRAAEAAGTALAANEARMRTFFDATFEGILVSENGVIKDLNDAVTQMAGYSAEDLIGKPLTVQVHPDDLGKVAEAIRKDHTEPYRIRIRRSDGSWFVAEVRGKSDPERPGVRLTAVRDMTNILEQEERLRGLVRDLERSNQDLEQFAYIASHDLQEPLRSVSSYVGLIARRYDDKLDDDGREFISYAIGGVYRMQALIRDLLDYSRVGTHGAVPAPRALAPLAEDARAALTAAIEDSEAEITIDPLPEAMADPAQITRVFQNLLSNSLKYRHPDAPPRIRISAVPEMPEPGQTAFWRFTVRDNGLGIAADYAEQVFLIFQRLHGQGAYEGTGIGLAITRRIIERHGGTIWVDTEVGEGNGAVIHFTLPAVPGDPAFDAPCQTAPATTPRAHALPALAD